MDNKVSETDLREYSNLEVGELVGKPTVVKDAIKYLSDRGYGKDLRGIQQRFGEIFKENPALRERYDEIFWDFGVFSNASLPLKMNDMVVAQMLGIPLDEVERRSRLAKRREILEQRILADTMHLGEFGRGLVEYMGDKALTSTTGEEFPLQRDKEDFIDGSTLCRQLYRVLHDSAEFDHKYAPKFDKSEE